MMSAPSHLMRNLVLGTVAIVAMLVISAAVVNGALAVVFGIMILWAIAVVLPLAVIEYDEHDWGRGGRPGAVGHG